MGSIDVAKVITAAAASSLGVLSLLILAVAFIGYNFFKRSGDRIKVGVFATMALAATGFGISVVREGREAAAEQRPPTSEVARVEPSPSPSPTATSATSVVAATGVAGAWHDDDGYLYDLAVEGAVLSYVQTKDGAKTGSGQGTISGRKVDYAYVNDLTVDRGTCTGLLSKDDTRIDGSCTSSGQRWGFAIMR